MLLKAHFENLVGIFINWIMANSTTRARITTTYTTTKNLETLIDYFLMTILYIINACSVHVFAVDLIYESLENVRQIIVSGYDRCPKIRDVKGFFYYTKQYG